MALRFGDYELDEVKRELRLRGEVLALQPLVFNLLGFLVRNRERVVTKHELLDALWPDTQVTEASLQRAVSLARRALKRGGMQHALRNYPRQGYRFCAEPEPAASDDWSLRCDHFRGRGELSVSDLEEWARSARWAGRLSEAIEVLERAVGAATVAGDRLSAARSALHLARLQHDRMDLAVAQGWLARAATLLQAAPECVEHARLAWFTARLANRRSEYDAAISHAARARELAARMGDTGMELAAVNESGHALLSMGLVNDGLARLDEAAAGVLAGEIDPEVGGIIYCGLIYASVLIGDWKRAGEWTEHFTRWCSRNNVSGFPGVCALHRAELLSFRGSLREAERELQQAMKVLPEAAPWAEGDAWRVLGDIRLHYGDLDAAEASFRRAHELGWEPQPGFALLQLRRGDYTAAARGLQAALEDARWFNRERRGLMLASLARIAAVSGDLVTAAEAVRRFEGLSEREQSPANRAVLARAEAEIALAQGDVDAACRKLRLARRLWSELGASLHAADERVRIAKLATPGRPSWNWPRPNAPTPRRV